MLKLRNKNVSLTDNIKYVVCVNYVNEESLNFKDEVKDILNNQKGIVTNYATGKKSMISSKTIGKLLYPSVCKNVYSKKYFNKLNASLYLRELFENAIYIDTFKPMKGKENNVNELGFHHFASLIYLDDKPYKVFITVREKELSSTLLISDIELFEYDGNIYDEISVADLFENTKIYDYKLKKKIVYNTGDFICDGYFTKDFLLV